MIKIYFHGGYRANNGPDNANRGIINSCDNKFSYTKSKNKIFKRIEYILKVLLNDVIVFGGTDVYAHIGIKLIKLLKKKSVYLMHGLCCYECEINGTKTEKRFLDCEQYIIQNVDLILCVSEKYMQWLKSYYPEYSEKIYYLYNGIDYIKRKGTKRHGERDVHVAVAGGDLPQKNNIKVCQAVEILNDESDKEICLNIYGKNHKGTDFSQYRYSKFIGNLTQEEFFEQLEDVKVFVVNSYFEPFCLAVAEALQCGCSVLISEHAGIGSLLELKENDIIHDVNNEAEIAEKISYLLEHPNNERIMSSLNFEKVSWKNTAETLYKICENLYKGKK